MKLSIRILLPLLCFVLQCKSNFAFDFNENDKVVFIGNSITHSGSFHNIIRVFMNTRYQKNITFYNKGISGNLTGHVLNRLENDILSEKPTVAFVMLGMNDILRHLYVNNPSEKYILQREQAIEKYKKDYKKLLNILIENKIRVILLTPTIYDESDEIVARNNKGVNLALKICSEYIKVIAKENSLEIIDLYTEFSTINVELQKKDKKESIVGKDRVHPGELGHFIIASKILDVLIKDERVVSNIVINNKKKRKKVISNNNVLEIQSQGKDKIEFIVYPNSLPFPSFCYDTLGLKLTSFDQNLNQELIKIEGLKSGVYYIKIDNIILDSLSNFDLENGISLSKYNTPQMKQSLEVYKLSRNIMSLQKHLRDLKFVEYSIIKIDPSKILTESEISSLVNQSLEKYSNNNISWHKYYTSKLSDYLDKSKNKEKYLSEIENLRQDLFYVSRPINYTFTIESI